MKWGYLRENEKMAEKARKLDGGVYTSLHQYLEVIFPDVSDWVTNKAVKGAVPPGGKGAIRPDYRSEELKLIVEFDGKQHYTDPIEVLKDKVRTKVYEELGYTVVRIPYFIQLTNEVVEEFFGVQVEVGLFDPTLPSFPKKELVEDFMSTPTFLCPAGLERMAREFKRFPQQYEVNARALSAIDDDALSGFSYLQERVNAIG